MEKRTSKSSRLIRGGLAVFTIILVILIFGVIHVVSGIQGTARVVNYAGLVRGGTQRMVKMEIAGEPQDKLIETIQSYIDGLRKGSKELDFVRLDDREFQDKMQELDIYFQKLKKEIYLVREKGYQNTEIISKSEKFFGICDEAVGLSEIYSQERATSGKTGKTDRTGCFLPDPSDSDRTYQSYPLCGTEQSFTEKSLSG